MICPHCGHEFGVLATRERKLLTPKELDTVRLLLSGTHKLRDIARLMGTTEQVVKNRLHFVYKKLGLRNRIDLARVTVSELEGLNARTT